MFGPRNALTTPLFLAKVATLGLSTLRWPTGNTASYWNWQTGWLNLGEAGICCGWTGFGKNTQTLDSVATGFATMGAKPLFLLNMISPTANTLDQLLQDQLAMLAAARDRGIPVQYVELGSEFYFLGDPKPGNTDFSNRFPTAQAYAAEAERWAAAIHAAFPGVHVSIVGALQNTNGNAQRRLTWNAGISQVFMPHVDAITMHDYFPAQLDGPRTPALLLATPFVNNAEYQNDTQRGYHSLDSTGKPIWVTEYNVGTNDDPTKAEWAHGLMSASKSLLYLADPVFERVTIFDLASPDFGSISRDGPWGTSAQGEALQIYAPAIRGAGSVEPLSFPAGPRVTVAVAGTAHVPAGPFTYPSLTGFAFADPGSSTASSLVLVNNTGATYRVDLGQVFGDTPHTFAQKAEDPAAPVDDSHPVPLTTGGGAGSDLLPVGPYSITRVNAS